MRKFCANCKKSIEKEPPLSISQFKKMFKAGDKVECFSTNKIVTLTAIGENRILYMDNGKERVGSIGSSTNAYWRKPKSRKKYR